MFFFSNQLLLTPRLFSKNLAIKIYKTIILPDVVSGSRMEEGRSAFKILTGKPTGNITFREAQA